jgi:hypothetical protein
MVEYVLTTTHVASMTGSVANALRGILSRAPHEITNHLPQVGLDARVFSDSIAGVPVGGVLIGLLALAMCLALTRNS